jgi:hypothetical protein
VKVSPLAPSARPAFSGATTGRGWFGAFQNLSREHAFEPLRVGGRIPVSFMEPRIEMAPPCSRTSAGAIHAGSTATVPWAQSTSRVVERKAR